MSGVIVVRVAPGVSGLGPGSKSYKNRFKHIIFPIRDNRVTNPHQSYFLNTPSFAFHNGGGDAIDPPHFSAFERPKFRGIHSVLERL